MEKPEEQLKDQRELEEEEEEEGEEEQVVEACLRGRPPRNRDSIGNGDTLLSAEFTNGAGSQELDVRREELLDNSAKDSNGSANGFHKEIEEPNGHEGSQRNVYYDKDEGADSPNGVSSMEHRVIPSSDSESFIGNERSYILGKKYDNGNGLSNVAEHHYQDNLKNNSLSDFGQPLSFDENNYNYMALDNKTIEDVSVNLIKEEFLEVPDLDVERVLEKQETHDLYCPNCNSCITKRVILRKRKRYIIRIGEEAKRNRPETVAQSSLDAIPADASHDQGPDSVDIRLDGSARANDLNRDGEPDIFRCLSCFSFFIPTGNGFKLFSRPEDKNKTEKLQNAQQRPPQVNKGWFSSMFSSSKRETLLDQGGAALDQSDLGIVNQLNSSSSSSKMQTNREGDDSAAQFAGRTPTDIGEKSEKGSSIRQHDGFKLQVPSKVDSLDNETSKSDQKLIVEKESPVSVCGESDMDGKDSISTVTPANDQIVGAAFLTQSVITDESTNFKKSDEDGAYLYEVSRHTITETKVNIHTEEPLNSKNEAPFSSVQDSLLHQDRQVHIIKGLKEMTAESNTGKETIIVVEEGPIEQAANIVGSAESGTSPHTEVQTQLGIPCVAETREAYRLEIMKSIVYGGLIESITSLGVVSSAAGADAATLNILALGLANMIGGLFIIVHNLWELKEDHYGGASNTITERVDRYQEQLGRRKNFSLHATVAILSFIIFGLLPPVVYGFSFRKSDNRDFKLIAVAAASLLCIIVLASGKTYVQRPPNSYIKTVAYYVTIGFMVSGVSYVAGDLINKLMEELGWFDQTSAVTLPLLTKTPMDRPWNSY